MNNQERRDAGLAYISDGDVFGEQRKCRKILQKINFMDRSDFEGINQYEETGFDKPFSFRI